MPWGPSCRRRAANDPAIIVYCAFDHNSGTARFDKPSRQEPVQTYSYNADGNVTAATQTGTGTERAGYTGTDLTSYTAVNGAKYTYTSTMPPTTSPPLRSPGSKSATTYNEAGNVAGSADLDGEKRAEATSSSATATPDRNHTQRVTDVNGSTTSLTATTRWQSSLF